MKKYPEFKSLSIPAFEKEILSRWKAEKTFERSVSERPENKPFIFYEGPPSANGTPGIHHVLSRTIKDLFCRYKTMQGYRVERKSGWDTHGLPVELGVEKMLGITKDDIGRSISVEEYNRLCRTEVMKYKNQWEELTAIMGYWVDMDNPYITFEAPYMETLWNLLKQLYDKGLLYKGYTIQPYSPAAGTGLSSHELNQPGTYKPVKDTTITAQFKLIRDAHALHPKLFATSDEVFFLAWTTTPWTLPSNCALAVGKHITYIQVECFNPYTAQRQSVILAEDRISGYFKEENKTHELDPESPNGWKILSSFKGSELADLRYEQLLPYQQPAEGDAFKVIIGDFVTTEDGTGIVHIAPSFGADDFRVAKQNGIGALTLVDKQGKFVGNVGPLSNMFVKNYTDDPNWENPDILIAKMLKEQNRAFRVEKYEHNYPHCWRTDKPVIYYPLDSWFIRTTAAKDKLIALNKQINWKPKSTGEGRFAQWLENLVDWNLSRSRFWGTPLPIWRTEDGTEERCIGSIAELREAYAEAGAAGLHDNSLSDMLNGDAIDLHKPYVDRIIIKASDGRPMYREPDLIDVWFDSGAMPYAQLHFPFENNEKFAQDFPADFIAEGVDQTRGWFFTLHVIAALTQDSIAYKNVVSNGLVLDKNGNKMSKRLGNTVNPFDTIYQYGADATRWYMISNAQPWDNLKFDIEGLEEVQRKFYGTLYNTYGFFALYANVDGFDAASSAHDPKHRTELDRWILSLLHSLIKTCTAAYDDYEPTRAARAIQQFTGDHLSNWYVRLSRRRFWKSENSDDKLAAYHTLYTCLKTIAQLMAPISPFMAEWLYGNVNGNTESVHLSNWPASDDALIDNALEERMQLAQDISSTILSLRKKEDIKVRQPLSRAIIPEPDAQTKQHIQRVEELIKSEVNIKAIEFMQDTTGIITKKIKPNFKALGPKLGADMKAAAALISAFGQSDIAAMEKSGMAVIDLNGRSVEISMEDVEILNEDIPGWLVANAGEVTVALDTHLTPELLAEGNAREFVSQLQRMRKEKQLDITDRIAVRFHTENNELKSALSDYKAYICAEILADVLEPAEKLPEFDTISVNSAVAQLNMTKV
ncbi:MAG: isoleucine--tRNA ligase [Chitinophagales bacterium]